MTGEESGELPGQFNVVLEVAELARFRQALTLFQARRLLHVPFYSSAGQT